MEISVSTDWTDIYGEPTIHKVAYHYLFQLFY